MAPEQRLASTSALVLLVTMLLPWYGLQSLNRKTGAIYSHSISAFGDVSFVEAAIFLVAVGVMGMLLARADGRRFQLPGGDGTIVMLAGGWSALLIFYRVFSRPAGDGYPVGIEWGFFLAFVAAGGLAYAGWRMRSGERPEPPLTRPRAQRRGHTEAEQPVALAAAAGPRRPLPPPTEPRRRGTGRPPRPPYPPPPGEQLSFEDPPTRPE